MDITVNMTAEEFLEFTDWRKDRTLYESKERAAAHTLEKIARAVGYAVEPPATDSEEFVIINQSHMSDVWMLTGEVFA